MRLIDGSMPAGQSGARSGTAAAPADVAAHTPMMQQYRS